MAISAVIIVSLALIVTILIPIIDLLLIAQLDLAKVENATDIIVSRVMLVITLVIFVALSYGTTLVEDKINIKKFGSIEKYENWQKQNFIVS